MLIMLMRTLIVAGLLMFGAVTTTTALAQDETVVATAEDDAAVAQTEPVTAEEDEGFDWGLLGLLGLLGLAGLAGLTRRPQPVVHDTDRVGTRPANRVGTQDPDDTAL